MRVKGKDKGAIFTQSRARLFFPVAAMLMKFAIFLLFRNFKTSKSENRLHACEK
jgi:hypothetical protein